MPNKKDIALSLLNFAASGRVRDVFAKHVSANFRHHNPFFKDGAEALMAGMEENARQFPQKRLEILHALQDGDLVAVHSRIQLQPGDRGIAVVHIFRFEGDSIAEVWDIGQPVPEKSENAAGMF